MNILGIIPARGGSSLKDKNIMDLMGKPLIGYTIEAALKSELINKLVVSTDDKKIADVARENNAQVIERPIELAQDDSPMEESVRHAIGYLEQNENYHTDIAVLLQANLPVRNDNVIDEVIKKLIDSGADSVVTVYEVTQLPEVMKTMDASGKLTPLEKEPVTGIRRQEFVKKFLLDGAVQAIREKVLRKTAGIRQAHVYLGKNVYGIIQESKYTIEIDSMEDYELAMYFLAKTKKETIC